jgi:hypothetical protein
MTVKVKWDLAADERGVAVLRKLLATWEARTAAPGGDPGAGPGVGTGWPYEQAKAAPPPADGADTWCSLAAWSSVMSSWSAANPPPPPDMVPIRPEESPSDTTHQELPVLPHSRLDARTKGGRILRSLPVRHPTTDRTGGQPGVPARTSGSGGVEGCQFRRDRSRRRRPLPWPGRGHSPYSTSPPARDG